MKYNTEKFSSCVCMYVCIYMYVYVCLMDLCVWSLDHTQETLATNDLCLPTSHEVIATGIVLVWSPGNHSQD